MTIQKDIIYSSQGFHFSGLTKVHDFSITGKLVAIFHVFLILFFHVKFNDSPKKKVKLYPVYLPVGFAAVLCLVLLVLYHLLESVKEQYTISWERVPYAAATFYGNHNP